MSPWPKQVAFYEPGWETDDNPRLTFEQFLERERLAEYRSEYHAGEVYAMSGGTEPHSRLASQVIALFHQRLPSCRVYEGNLMLRIERFDKGVYADCMVLCGEPIFWRKRKDVILNPTIVVEILSAPTEAYDKFDKSMCCRSVPSLQHCLLISQETVFVEHSTRKTDGSWTIEQLSDRTATISFSSLGAEIAVAEIYRAIL